MQPPSFSSSLPALGYHVILLAAGQGRRFSSAQPKQWTKLGGKLVVEWALTPFLADQRLGHLVLVVHPDFLDRANALAHDPRIRVVAGGDSRTQSTWAGLTALEVEATEKDFVLIHDAARPLVPLSLIERVLEALAKGAKAVVPVLPMVDTIKDLETGKTINRDTLCRSQTPQGFPFALIKSAHQQELSGTDDANLVEQLGHTLTLVKGDERASKLTTPHDQLILQAQLGAETMVRTGFGFDVHAFMGADNQALSNGDIAHRKELILGGIRIPSSVEGAIPLAGHSDADVVLHCVTDALLGAIAEGDIGQHFPPTDPKWRGADSSQFLIFAVKERLSKHQARINNIDITIICERPKIGPFRDKISRNIARLCSVSPSQVNVKASTTERLGFTGRGEGIACQAVATVMVPCP